MANITSGASLFNLTQTPFHNNNAAVSGVGAMKEFIFSDYPTHDLFHSNAAVSGTATNTLLGLNSAAYAPGFSGNYKVTGSTLHNSAPAYAAWILLSSSGTSRVVIRAAYVDANIGTFSFNNLAAGTYTAKAIDPTATYNAQIYSFIIGKNQ